MSESRCVLAIFYLTFTCITQLPPKLKSFDAEEFLRTVEHSGPQLTTGLKGSWTGLYRFRNILINF